MAVTLWDLVPIFGLAVQAPLTDTSLYVTGITVLLVHGWLYGFLRGEFGDDGLSDFRFAALISACLAPCGIVAIIAAYLMSRKVKHGWKLV